MSLIYFQFHVESQMKIILSMMKSTFFILSLSCFILMITYLSFNYLKSCYPMKHLNPVDPSKQPKNKAGIQKVKYFLEIIYIVGIINLYI